MARLFGFDYKSPYFYMVTSKAIKGMEPFSRIGPEGIIENDITRALAAAIRSFHLKWRCIEEISPFVIMPDHIHLLIKIRDAPVRKSLPVLVWQLCRALSAEYLQVAGGRSHPPLYPAAPGRVLRLPAVPGNIPSPAAPGNILEKSWHDWIVKKRGQLEAFRNYIKENPPRIKERYCASGRMLFLSLYEAGTRKCDNATLYRRCHEMGDVIFALSMPASPPLLRPRRRKRRRLDAGDFAGVEFCKAEAQIECCREVA